ncbi:MAG: hypothetical protein M3P08_11375 [Thermoproteota archaeon]|nr:hypothetical protein [Thermoproteota archaeon]
MTSSSLATSIFLGWPKIQLYYDRYESGCSHPISDCMSKMELLMEEMEAIKIRITALDPTVMEEVEDLHMAFL